MADSLLKLRVESSEYDAKLKKAAEGIRHLADVAHTSGGELTGLEKAELDYIKALGDMETKSRSAAGQVRELSSTYRELKVVYDQLNEVEKADEGGKALAASLEQLRQRTQQAKSALDAATQSLNDNGQSGQESSGILEQLAGKFTINIDAIKLFNAGLTAAKAALDVAKDAFFASEANVDEWGRTVASAESVYQGFLNSINNGDISGFLGRIDQIVQAAREAYNALDTLGTMKTIQAPQISAQQTENERMRMMIQTGRYIAPGDGRKASMKDGQLLTPEQIKRIEQQLQNGMKTVVGLVGNEVKQTGKAIDAYYNKIAKENGMSMQEFRKGTSSWDEFSKKMAGYEQYKAWDKQARTEFAKQGGRGNVDFDKSNPYAEFKKWGNFRVDKQGANSYNDLVRLIQQRDQQVGQTYSMQSQAYRTMNRAEGVTVRQIMGGGSGGKGSKGTTEEIDDFQEIVGLIPNAEEAVKSLQQQIRESWDEGEIVKLKEQLSEAEKELKRLKELGAEVKPAEMVQGQSGLSADLVKDEISRIQQELSQAEFGTAIYNDIKNQLAEVNILDVLMDSAAQNGVEVPEELREQLLEGLLGGDIPDELIEQLLNQLNENLEGKGKKKKKINKEEGIVSDDETEKKTAKITDTLGDLSGGMSQMVNGLEQLGIDIPEGMNEVIGGIQAVTSVLTGIATIVSAIQTFAAVQAFKLSTGGMVWKGGVIHAATGTVVPGNFGYDAVPALLTSGEVVLNRAQQGNLAAQLEGGGMSGLSLDTVLRGEDIRIALNNNGRRTGRGEFVQTRKY